MTAEWELAAWEDDEWGGSSTPPVDLPLDEDAWRILPDGGRPTGPPDEWGGLRYPFVDPEPELRGILADFWLSHPFAGVLRPLALAWMYGFDRAVNGGTLLAGGDSSTGADPRAQHAVDLLVIDARGAAVFSSTLATYYKATAFGPRLVVHEWRNGLAVCRAVQHVAVARAEEARPLPRVIRPVRGRLDARTNELVPRHVSSAAIDPALPIRGELSLVAGYNVVLTAAPVTAGLRTATEVTIVVVPGAGLGRAPGCDDSRYIRTINRQGAEHAAGNFALQARDCYSLRPPTPTARAALRLGSDCVPCCDCVDYEDIQHGVLASWAQYRSYSDRVFLEGGLTAVLTGMIAEWNAQKACRDANTLAVNAVAYGGLVDVIAQYANNAPACAHDVTITVALDFTGLGSEAVALDPEATYKLDDNGGSEEIAPAYTAPTDSAPGSIAATWAVVGPGVAVGLRFRLSLATTGHTFTAAATATVGGIPAPGAASKTIAQ